MPDFFESQRQRIYQPLSRLLVGSFGQLSKSDSSVRDEINTLLENEVGLDYIKRRGLLGTLAGSAGRVYHGAENIYNELLREAKPLAGAIGTGLVGTEGAAGIKKVLGQGVNQPDRAIPSLATGAAGQNTSAGLSLRFSEPVISTPKEPVPTATTPPTPSPISAALATPPAVSGAEALAAPSAVPVYTPREAPAITEPVIADTPSAGPGTSQGANVLGAILGGAARAVAGPFQQGTGAQLGALGQQLAQNRAAGTYLSDVLAGKEPDPRGLAIIPPEQRVAILESAEQAKDRQLARRQSEVKMQLDMQKLRQEQFAQGEERAAAGVESQQRAIQIEGEQRRTTAEVAESGARARNYDALAERYRAEVAAAAPGQADAFNRILEVAKTLDSFDRAAYLTEQAKLHPELASYLSGLTGTATVDEFSLY